MVSSYSDFIGAEPDLGHRPHLGPGPCGLCLRGPGHRPVLTGDRGMGDLHDQRHHFRGAPLTHGDVARQPTGRPVPDGLIHTGILVLLVTALLLLVSVDLPAG